MKHFSDQYCNIISDILEKGVEETNNRTGVKTKSLPGVQFQVDLQKEFPLLTARKIRVENFIAETMWFLSGANNTNDWLNSKTKIWEHFTTEKGKVETAYGYRWRKHFFRDQIDELIALLKKDPSSRHGVVVTWDPSTDGLLGKPKKNIPCPYTFTVNIIGGKLHLHNIVRSNDMILGCPTDAAGFAFLALILAQELNVKPGMYTHSISNAHIYKNHYKAADEMCNRWASGELSKVPSIVLPVNSFICAESKNDIFFEMVVNRFRKVYKPLASIKGLVIAL